jgi:hypothetical protein
LLGVDGVIDEQAVAVYAGDSTTRASAIPLTKASITVVSFTILVILKFN